MSSYLDQKVGEIKKNEEKASDMVLYSGHEVNLLYILASMGLTEQNCLIKILRKAKLDTSALTWDDFARCQIIPDFAADIRLELVEDAKGILFVAMLYQNRFINICAKNGNGVPLVSGNIYS